MWDKLMVRIYAIFKVPRYRELVALWVMVIGGAVVLIKDIVMLAIGEKFTVFGLLITIIVLTAALYSAIELRRYQNGNKEK